MRRRRFLRAGAAAAALGLAGCTGGDGTEPTDTEPPATASPTPVPSEAATATPTASPTDTHTTTSTPMSGSPTSSTATASPTPTRTPTPTPDQTVTVGPGGQLSFDPKSFEIAVGDTVLWTWDAGGHNVKPSTTPDGVDWTGTPGEEFDTFGAGHTYTYTFEVAGTYEYYCAPHQSSGMTGSFTVG